MCCLRARIMNINVLPQGITCGRVPDISVASGSTYHVWACAQYMFGRVPINVCLQGHMSRVRACAHKCVPSGPHVTCEPSVLDILSQAPACINAFASGRAFFITSHRGLI